MHRRFPHHAEARYAVAEHTEVFCNRQRLQKALGYRSPEDFEQQWQLANPWNPKRG